MKWIVLFILVTVSAAQAADSVFDVKTNGFGFRNYANDDDIENLTPAEMVRLFGPVVNARGEGSEITLVPAAEEWMEQINEIINIGHCEGLAVLSSLFHIGEQKPSDFGAETTNALTLEDNPKLQREIAMWWATQLTDTTRAAKQRLAPNEALEILRKSLPPKGPDTAYTIAIWMPDHTRGHAITPCQVVDTDDTHSRIMVYDNNFPNQPRFIEVDREANTWSYSTQVNPAAPTNAYTGDAETKTLELTPCVVREQVQQLALFGDAPFSEDDGLEKPSDDADKPGDEAPDDDDDEEAGASGAALKEEMKSTASERKYAQGTYHMEITLSGQGADLLIKDAKGLRLGVADGKYVNEIPGAEIVRPMGLKLPPGIEAPRYRVPGGVDYTIALTGTAEKPSKVKVSCLNRGAELVVEDITVEKGSTDSVYFSPDGTRVAYRPSGDEHPTLIAGYGAKGPDYEITVNGVETSPGAMVQLEIVPKTGCAKVQVVDSKTPATVEVWVERYGPEGTATYKNDDLKLDPNDAAYFRFAAWKGDKTPMTVSIDKGGDGKLDSVTPFADEPGK